MRILVVFFILFLSGCQVTTPEKKNTLRISFANYPTTIDPRKSGDFISSTLICLLYEGLTRCTKGIDVELALAKKVEISADGKTYLFFLKSSVWSDGHPVTAYDFEKSWKKIIQPEFPSLCAYLLYPIKNAEKCAKGLCSSDEVGIHAIHDKLLRVELENPAPYFLSLTAFPLYLPTPSHIDQKTPSWDQNPGPHLVCNGPFSIKSLIPNHEIILQKNPFFWNPNSIHLDGIHISMIINEMTALQLFEKEELDLLGGPLTLIQPEILQDHNAEFLPMAGSTFCTFNTQIFPFHNSSLRKAFALAMQGDAITKEIRQLGQLPAIHLLPPSLSLYDAPSGFESNQNPETLTARHITELHYPTNKENALYFLAKALEELQITTSDLENLTLYYKPNLIDKKLAQTLQRQWIEILNIPIQIEQIDPKTLTQRLYARNYQLSLASWIAQFHDPINLLERFKDKENAKNYPGWENPEYIDLLKKAVCTINSKKRFDLLQKAELILMEETIIAPLYHWSSPILSLPRVRGLETTSCGGILIEHCKIIDN